MNMLKFLFWPCFLIGLPIQAWWRAHRLRDRAVITAPVADMLIHQADHYRADNDVAGLYKNQPFSCLSSSWPCIRVHQCLMNELLMDASWSNQQCSGSVPDAYYGTDEATNKPLCKYYTLASNTLSLETLRAKGVDLDSLPPPSWAKRDSSVQTVILLMPWYDAARGLTYSAGTRFVRVPELDTRLYYAIKIVDFRLFKVHKTLISKAYCLVEGTRSIADKRQLFLEILKKWTHQSEGQIPYVLGGSSFVDVYPRDGEFWSQAADSGTNRIWTRPGNAAVRTGFDCSELVWRAARMASIAYFYKNTSTLAHYLEPLGHTDIPKDGDLLWVPGHVMIMSDIARNELIESTGYSGGYGVVHRVSLKQRLGSKYSSYRDILRAYRNKEGISIYALDGTPQWYPEFTIFKLVERRKERAP